MRIRNLFALVAAIGMAAGTSSASTIPLISPTLNDGSFETDIGASGFNNGNNADNPIFNFSGPASFFSFDRNDGPSSGFNPANAGGAQEGVRTLVFNNASNTLDFNSIESIDIALPGPLLATDTFDFAGFFGGRDVGEFLDVTATLQFDVGSDVTLLTSVDQVQATSAVRAENEFFELTSGGPIGVNADNVGATTVSLLVSLTADVNNGDGVSQFFVDNLSLSVTTIPEPSAVALGLLGLAGVAVRRRR